MKKEYINPEDYINQQPKDRIASLNKIRQTIKDNLPIGFEEVIQYGMIGYVVPKSIYPLGYHANPKEPLPFISLGNQKNYIAVYHLGIYVDKELLNWFENYYKLLNIGKLDMGKSCIRFKNTNKIPYELIGELCSKITLVDYIKLYNDNKPKK